MYPRYNPGILFKPTQTVHIKCTLDITQVYNLNLLRLYINNVPHTQCIFIKYIEYRSFNFYYLVNYKIFKIEIQVKSKY